MKISWVILTFNRKDTVEKSVAYNMLNAGYQWDEMVWVDNGSKDGTVEMMRGLEPDVCVLHKENLGVGPGYNRGMAMATGDYIVITGCDMMMPKDWLRTFKEYMAKIPQTGVACMYSVPIEKVPERYRGSREVEYLNGLPLIHAMPMERRIFSRKLLHRAGYLREDLGLYGWEDVEWGERVERVTKEHRQINYVIPGMIAEHLGTEGISKWDAKDPKEYHAFKQEESRQQWKQNILDKCRNSNWPYYNPYSGAI